MIHTTLQERKVLILFSLLFLLGILVSVYRKTDPNCNTCSIDLYSKGKSISALDINSATPEQLAELPGIGDVIAQRIVARRQENGAFKDLEELIDVNGIGNSKLEQLRPYLKIEID